MREKELEQKFKKSVEKMLGALVWKFVSPGVAGVPDRIVIMNGHIAFVELKAPGKKLRKLQKYRVNQLRNKGIDVFVIDSEQAINDFSTDMALLGYGDEF